MKINEKLGLCLMDGNHFIEAIVSYPQNRAYYGVVANFSSHYDQSAFSFCD
jgi:hypothetical protein